MRSMASLSVRISAGSPQRCVREAGQLDFPIHARLSVFTSWGTLRPRSDVPFDAPGATTPLNPCHRGPTPLGATCCTDAAIARMSLATDGYIPANSCPRPQT
jgi:hypothetical protein